MAEFQTINLPWQSIHNDLNSGNGDFNVCTAEGSGDGLPRERLTDEWGWVASELCYLDPAWNSNGADIIERAMAQINNNIDIVEDWFDLTGYDGYCTLNLLKANEFKVRHGYTDPHGMCCDASYASNDPADYADEGAIWAVFTTLAYDLESDGKWHITGCGFVTP